MSNKPPSDMVDSKQERQDFLNSPPRLNPSSLMLHPRQIKMVSYPTSLLDFGSVDTEIMTFTRADLASPCRDENR